CAKGVAGNIDFW
nr:immunoglobulin heavy chain junction region [Macaca mulatta]MOW79367.1 immunoglobulin heavy chain junction region [Macaca mulatta]MOW80551.1 immunoglobulin heavy chain junction region [Macaca mulatta]MOW83904.1 immunoglobulin heavy chain junction region [Macaca mulatta]